MSVNDLKLINSLIHEVINLVCAYSAELKVIIKNTFKYFCMNPCCFCLFLLFVLEIELGAIFMLGKRSSIEVYPLLFLY